MYYFIIWLNDFEVWLNGCDENPFRAIALMPSANRSFHAGYYLALMYYMQLLI